MSGLEFVAADLSDRHEYRHGCSCDDCDVAITVDVHTFATGLVWGMRRNPRLVWCKRRGCAHAANVHDGALGCMTEGCACEGLVE
jgi:hypothetical protein